MGIDPGRLCGCTIGCTLSAIETRRKGVICRYRNGEVKPDSYFVVGGDPTPRRALHESVEVVPRSVAEALANGIVAALGLEPVRMNEAAAALAEYRAAYPKDTP